MKKYLAGLAVSALVLVGVASGSSNVRNVHRLCVRVDHRAGQTFGDYSATYGKHVVCLVARDGKNGKDGKNGLNGATGATGLAGAKGANGATGAAGTNGVNGADGAIGATGETGATGATGEAGPIGPAGPKGDTGAQGPPGADGADGLDGSTIVTVSADGTEGEKTTTVSCPAGKLAISGGFDAQGSVTASFRVADGTGWTVTQSSGNTDSLKVYAYCA